MASRDSSASSSEALSLGLASPISLSTSSSVSSAVISPKRSKHLQDNTINKSGYVRRNGCFDLSLPESFDDTLSVFGTNRSVCTSQNDNPRCNPVAGDQSTDILIQFASMRKTVQDLKNKLKRRDQRIEALSACLDGRKQSIRDIVVSDEKYEYLKQRPEKDLGLVDFVSVTFYEKMAKFQKANDQLQQKCQELSQSSFQDLERAHRSLRDVVSAKNAAEMQSEVFKADLTKSEALHKEAKLKISDLQSNIVELQEKGRRFDDVFRKQQTGEAELLNLRKLVENTEESMKKLVLKDAKNQEKHLNAEKKIELLGMDKSLLQKELTIVTDRALRVEDNVKKLENDLHEVTMKKDALLLQLNQGREKLGADYTLKLETETANLKLHANREITEARVKASDKWQKEVELMREEKDKAMQELETVQNKLLECKSLNNDLNVRLSSFEVKWEDHSKESRNEIISKEIENAKLAVVNETLRANLRKAALQNEYLRDQIILHQQNFCKLEVDAKSECKRMNKQLKDLSKKLCAQTKDECEGNGTHGAVEYTNRVSDPWNVELLGKSDVMRKKKGNQHVSLLALKEKNAQLQRRLDVATNLFQRLRKSSRPLAESFRKQEEELSILMNEVRLLHADLANVSSERDQLQSTLSRVLEQRNEISHMKNIVDELQKSPTKKFSDRDHTESAKGYENSFAGHLFHKDQRCAVESKEAWHSPGI
mmetsp:Transcript_26792/g.39683  ORF Transcript_26792/g.39683 Transcript_26792/m.39683 type:complete len:711 (-) Transcript_26792:214-2346(-)